jgi:hypothetical protein
LNKKFDGYFDVRSDGIPDLNQSSKLLWHQYIGTNWEDSLYLMCGLTGGAHAETDR